MIKLEDLNLSEEDLDSLQKQLNDRKKKEVYEGYIEKIDEHKKYIGKCFKEKNKDKYIRVLSSKSSNQYRLECMCFEFPIKFSENHRLTMIFNPENAFSTIDFEGIYVEDYPLLCSNWLDNDRGNVIDSLIPISQEEYFEKMNEYVKALQEKVENGEFDTSKDNKSIFKK